MIEYNDIPKHHGARCPLKKASIWPSGEPSHFHYFADSAVLGSIDIWLTHGSVESAFFASIVLDDFDTDLTARKKREEAEAMLYDQYRRAATLREIVNRVLSF